MKYNAIVLREDISLRPLSEEDAPAIFRWVCDPEIATNIGLTRKPSLEYTLSWIRRQKSDPSIRAFAILSKGVHTGNVVLDQIDNHVGKARFSIYIGEAFERDRGAGFTAAYLAIEEGFQRLGMDKIWLTVHSRNERAIKSFQRLGFVQEGILRGEFLLDGERLALIYMGLLRKEFLFLAGKRLGASTGC